VNSLYIFVSFGMHGVVYGAFVYYRCVVYIVIQRRIDLYMEINLLFL
jgi:hypothetical protein